MGRRFLPPLTAVPVVTGEEAWRERPRLRAMNSPPRARSRVVHATVPGVHVDVSAASVYRVHLSGPSAAQIACRIDGRIAGCWWSERGHARRQTCVQNVVERRDRSWGRRRANRGTAPRCHGSRAARAGSGHCHRQRGTNHVVPTTKLRTPDRKSSSRRRPMYGWRASSAKRAVIESITRSATSMLLLWVARKCQISSRSDSACGATRKSSATQGVQPPVACVRAV